MMRVSLFSSELPVKLDPNLQTMDKIVPNFIFIQKKTPVARSKLRHFANVGEMETSSSVQCPYQSLMEMI